MNSTRRLERKALGRRRRRLLCIFRFLIPDCSCRQRLHRCSHRFRTLPGQEVATDPSSWATLSPGNLNLPLIEDWTSRTLGELSKIAEHATKDYFGAGPSYSYFTGCSAGGRQGLELAQTFPDAFDGILAAAPAIYFETFLVSGYWPTLLMNHLKGFPSQLRDQGLRESCCGTIR